MYFKIFFSNLKSKYLIFSIFKATLNGRMLLFDGLDFTTRIIKLRPKQPDCIMCQHENKSIDILDAYDYNLFCGVSNYNDKALDIKLLDNETQRLNCSKYKELLESNDEHLLIDVRPRHEFQICSLQKSFSIFDFIKFSFIIHYFLIKKKDIPFDKFTYDLSSTLELVKQELKTLKTSIAHFF